MVAAVRKAASLRQVARRFGVGVATVAFWVERAKGQRLDRVDIGAPEPELINTIFRVAHSIKGGSATFGFSDIASFTHSLETLLDELRSGGMQVTLASVMAKAQAQRAK